MPADIDLLRHGDTGFTGFRGSLDDELSPTGWQQMQFAVDKRAWDVVVSSSLQRCAAFAEQYAIKYKLPLHLDARLQELHFGAWEGRTAAQLMESDAEHLQRFWQDPERHAPPGGETLSGFSARVLEALHDIELHHGGQRVLVVTHGGVIRRLLCHARNLPLGEMLSLEVSHGSLHRLTAMGVAA